MNQDPMGNRQSRGRGGGLRLLVVGALLLYGAYYYFSNRTVDPYTGEQVLIDKTLDAEQESALGLQAYREILSQERPVDPNSEIAQRVAELTATQLRSDLGVDPGVHYMNY